MRGVIVMAVAAVLAVSAALTGNVAAQQPDTRDRTIMTFSGAVELPGMRLDPGTYVFRIADTPSRNVIQVFAQDEKEILGQWLFVPAQRLDVTGDTVVTFRETSAGATPAVQFWFYPGEKIGKEFIYPKDQALRIAQRTGATVLTEDGPVSSGAQASVQVEQQSVQADTQIAPAQEPQGVGVVAGSGLPDTSAEPVATTGSADGERDRGDQAAAGAATAGTARGQQEGTLAQAELPQTASPAAFSGLLALLSLAGAFGIRLFRS